MAEKVNLRQALRVFQRVITEGRREGGEYHLKGVIASTDFDGYTVTLRNDYVHLDIFFHNTISFEYANLREKALFLETLELLDK